MDIPSIDKNKGADVYIADFKGGVDFPGVWHEKCRMCFEERELLDLLTGLADELQRRKAAFAQVEIPNIDAYSKATNSNLNRIIFARDEVAEVLDKTWLTKERKDLFSQIERQMSLIARQGRAFWHSLGVFPIIKEWREQRQTKKPQPPK